MKYKQKTQKYNMKTPYAKKKNHGCCPKTTKE